MKFFFFFDIRAHFFKCVNKSLKYYHNLHPFRVLMMYRLSIMAFDMLMELMLPSLPPLWPQSMNYSVWQMYYWMLPWTMQMIVTLVSLIAIACWMIANCKNETKRKNQYLFDLDSIDAFNKKTERADPTHLIFGWISGC